MAAHAFVLHLGRASERRANARALLDACGLSAEIWPAVDGAALDDATRAAHLGTHLFAPRYPFALRPGEIGCFLSHRQIWAEILRRELDWALVLEDDAALDAALFPAALELAARAVPAIGYVQLQTRAPRGPATELGREGPCRLSLPVLTPLRTSAQLVSRDGAARLLACSRRFDRPVDSFVQSHWFTGLRAAVVHPAGVSTLPARLAASTIQKGRKPLAERLWREVARLVYRRRVARRARLSPAALPRLPLQPCPSGAARGRDR
ncbi:MAG: hypothetical protein Kow0058_07450 [Roseovarius sp.]